MPIPYQRSIGLTEGAGRALFPHRAGDFRGPYGIGRPAHGSDPNATYGFQPQPDRTLPIRDRHLLTELYQPDIDPSRQG